MPTGIRPDAKISKILYKIMKTPKTLQQSDKNFSVKVLKGWKKETTPIEQAAS